MGNPEFARYMFTYKYVSGRIIDMRCTLLLAALVYNKE